MNPEAGSKSALYSVKSCFCCTEQKQEGFGGCTFGEVSLDCHYQSELVVLQEANTGAT